MRLLLCYWPNAISMISIVKNIEDNIVKVLTVDGWFGYTSLK